MDAPVLLSEQRAEISPFPRSLGILEELLDYKDKGSRDFSDYSSPANSGWKRRGEVLLVIQTVKSDYRGFKLANTNMNTRNLQVVTFTQAGFPSSVPVPVWLPLTGQQHALLSLYYGFFGVFSCCCCLYRCKKMSLRNNPDV